MLTLPDFPVRQRDFLLEISRAITARLDLSEVLKRVLHASVVMIAGQVGIIALKSDEEEANFHIRAFTGFQQDLVPMLNEKLQELVEGAEGNGWDYEYLYSKLGEMAEHVDPSLSQSIAMPLIFDQKPLGLLVVYRSYQATVTPNDASILQSFADQAAIAVHNAQMYESISQERKRLSAILQYSGDGVMILDASLTIRQVNQAFEQITGWTSDEAVGLFQDDVINWVRIEQNDLQTAIQNGWPHHQPSSDYTETLLVQGEIQRKDGMMVSIGITYSPLFTDEGRLSNVIANVRDITLFRRAQEMQNVFISTVSHELRTPVALIKGYASTLSRADANWDMSVVHQSLEVIEEEADRLTDLIDDLLTASKIQAEQTVSLNFADVNLENIAHRAVERFRTQTNNHDFVMSFSEDFPSIQADARRIRQVIDNLLTNAIKYAKDGTITVGGRFNTNTVTIFVRDQGQGIDEQNLPRVFERFYRIDDNLTSKTQGTGLGLYLVKAIIEAHNGSINVKSQLGTGSTFFFTLPRDGSSL